MAEVVLDENVYIRALQAECTLDERDMQAARVVRSLQTSHVWVFTSDVAVAYRKQFSRNRCTGTMSTQLMKSLTDVFFDKSRFLWIEDPTDIDGDYHHKDRHIVSAAAARRGGYLVTEDHRLAGQLRTALILEIFGFSIVSLAKADELLRPEPGNTAKET